MFRIKFLKLKQTILGQFNYANAENLPENSIFKCLKSYSQKSEKS